LEVGIKESKAHNKIIISSLIIILLIDLRNLTDSLIRFLRKFGDNPFVPIGCIATTGFLVSGIMR